MMMENLMIEGDGVCCSCNSNGKLFDIILAGILMVEK